MRNYRVGYVDVDGTPEAVFVDSTGDCSPGKVQIFALMGEHAEADIDWVRSQALASPDLYADLHAYLTRRYANPPGDCLNLVVDQAAVPR